MCVAILTCPFPIILAEQQKCVGISLVSCSKPSKAQKTAVKSSCPKAQELEKIKYPWSALSCYAL